MQGHGFAGRTNLGARPSGSNFSTAFGSGNGSNGGSNSGNGSGSNSGGSSGAGGAAGKLGGLGTTPWAKGDLVEVLGCLKVRGEHHIEHQDTGEQRDGEDE